MRQHLTNSVDINAMREKERGFFVVTGTHYGTKTPADQQPTELCAGGMTRLGAIYSTFSSMVSRVRCLVCYVIR